MLTDAAEDVLAFTGFPQAHWRKLWSTRPLDRLNGEIKRRTNFVGIFPNDASVLRLITAVVVETHDEWQVVERRYLSEESMAKIHATGNNEPTAITEPPIAVTARPPRPRRAPHAGRADLHHACGTPTGKILVHGR